MFDLIPLVFAGVFLATLGHSVWAMLDLVKRRRMVEDVATAKVRSAHQGYVELEGRAANLYDDPLHSPLTGLPCLWYRIRVRKYVGGRNNSWHTIRTEESTRPFLLDDATGRCVVEPAGADVTCHHQWVWHGPRPQPAGVPSGDAINPGMMLITRDRQYEYTEELVEDGERLYGIGRFRSYLRDAQPLLQRLRGHVVRAWKRAPEMLAERFDANGDGQVDLQEWQQAEAAAEADVRRRIEGLAGEGQVHFLGRAGRDRPFILSTLSQPDLVGAYRRKTLISMGITALVGVVTVSVLVNHGLLG